MGTSLTLFIADDMQEAINLANPRNGIAYTQAFTDACEVVGRLSMRGNNALMKIIIFQPCGELPDHPGHYVAQIDKWAADQMASLPYGESEYHPGLAIKGAWYLAAACSESLFVLVEA
jgi:hypothetical protein